MIHSTGDSDSRKKIVIDCLGTQVPGVIEYDDKTQEATIILTGTSNKYSKPRLVVVQPVIADLDGCHPIGKFQPIKIKVKIPGSKIKYLENTHETD